MKIVRTAGMAGLMALALIALLGVGSAAAAKTVLCKTSITSPHCGGQDIYPAGTKLQAKAIAGKPLVFEGKGPFSPKISCTESTLNATTLAKGGKPLEFEMNSWTIGHCGWNKEMNNCTVESGVPGAGGYIGPWSGEQSGWLYLGIGAGSWTLKCGYYMGFEFNCPFETSETETILEGGSPATAWIYATNENYYGGGTCPTSVYAPPLEFSSPKPLYVAEEGGGTAFCAAAENPCSLANNFPTGTKIEAQSSNFAIKAESFSPTSFSCKSTTATFETQAASGNPLPVKQTGFSGSSCNSSAWSSGCTLSTSILSPTDSVLFEGQWFGTLEEIGVHLNFLCSAQGIYHECGVDIHVTSKLEGGSPATFDLAGGPAEWTSGICKGLAGEVTSGLFSVTSPKPLYVSKL
jgi:hypothetical protein